MASGLASWRRAARAVADLPPSFRIVLFGIAVLHAVGLSWGMPSSDGWDVDGVAPRDFLPGLVATYTPGEFYTYPPLHLAILAVLSLPVVAVAALRAGSVSVAEVIPVILQPPYMTAMALIARVVTLVMSLGVVVATSKLAAELVPEERRRSTELGTAVVVGVGVPFTYYSHVTNLDVPYMFWASFAALGVTRAIARREARRLRKALLLAGLATATKDQAYAIFVLGVPAALGAWTFMDAWARRNVRAIAREAAIGGALTIALLALVDGAVTNPSGFRARVAFLTGSASQDFAFYSKDVAGALRLLWDLVLAYGFHYPAVFAVLHASGLFLALRASDAPRRVAALVPLLLAVSFSVAFNAAARRVEQRFTLPQAILLSVYGGIALERATCAIRSGALRIAARVACAGLVLWALWRCVELDANLVLDPRYRAEAWLRERVRSGDTIETYGLNVHLPRFPEAARVVRVGSTPIEKRGPMPGIEEVVAPFLEIAARRPRFVVVSECYSWRWIQLRVTPLEGRILPTTLQRLAANEDGVTFFDRLFVGQLGYDLVEIARFEHPIFRRVELHGSVGCPIYILERRTQVSEAGTP